MSPVHSRVVVHDACDPSPQVILATVTSSEPDDAPGGGDGNTTNDIQGAILGIPDFDVLLRAERAGNGPGRTYTIRYQARDASGKHRGRTRRRHRPPRSGWHRPGSHRQAEAKRHARHARGAVDRRRCARGSVRFRGARSPDNPFRREPRTRRRVMAIMRVPWLPVVVCLLLAAAPSAVVAQAPASTSVNAPTAAVRPGSGPHEWWPPRETWRRLPTRSSGSSRSRQPAIATRWPTTARGGVS